MYDTNNSSDHENVQREEVRCWYIPREVLKPPTRDRVRATETFGSICVYVSDLRFPLQQVSCSA